jgi:PncC family amidohydrolase
MSGPDELLAEGEVLAVRVVEVCLGRGLTLATAESCTGGLIGHLLTQVPGVSRAYLGGLISYADRVKVEQLGVAGDVVERHGAVSAQVCVAMAEGVRRVLRSDVAVAVTGIAGPDGGSPDKPVGLTYVAVADERGNDVRRHRWDGDRAANKAASAVAALGMLLARVGGPTGS